MSHDPDQESVQYCLSKLCLALDAIQVQNEKIIKLLKKIADSNQQLP